MFAIVSQKFSTAISKGLDCVDPSNMIFRNFSKYLPVNTWPHITSVRLWSRNEMLRLHGVVSKCKKKLICYLYVHCCCCIHYYIIKSHTGLDYELSTNFKILLRRSTCKSFWFDYNAKQTILNTVLNTALRKSLTWWVFGCGRIWTKVHI